VLSALNGKLAIDLIEENKNLKIDILVTDVVMPVMGGGELAKKLRMIFPKIKILYCSGYPYGNGVSHDGIMNGNVDYIPKPYSGEELAKKIREILEKS
jgi:YesN/AraC family two-component response regulator